MTGDAVNGADIVLKVRRPLASELSRFKRSAIIIAIMDRFGHEVALRAMADAGVTAFAMEFCRAFPAPRRWTYFRARPISPATGP